MIAAPHGLNSFVELMYIVFHNELIGLPGIHIAGLVYMSKTIDLGPGTAVALRRVTRGTLLSSSLAYGFSLHLLVFDALLCRFRCM